MRQVAWYFSLDLLFQIISQCFTVMFVVPRRFVTYFDLSGHWWCRNAFTVLPLPSQWYLWRLTFFHIYPSMSNICSPIIIISHHIIIISCHVSLPSAQTSTSPTSIASQFSRYPRRKALCLRQVDADCSTPCSASRASNMEWQMMEVRDSKIR
jgi:hypothetical protein